MATPKTQMPAPTFRHEVQDGIASIFMDVPGEPVNTLRPDFEDELSGILSRLEGDGAVKAIVFTSGKPEGFIAGADVSMLARVRTQAEATALSRGGQQAMERLEELSRRKPVVAAIHGAALGGGLEVALACTYRIARDDGRTQLGQPEVQLGLVPGAGGTQRLPALIGIAQALDLILTGKSVRASKARKLGPVDGGGAGPGRREGWASSTRWCRGRFCSTSRGSARSSWRTASSSRSGRRSTSR